MVTRAHPACRECARLGQRRKPELCTALVKGASPGQWWSLAAVAAVMRVRGVQRGQADGELGNRVDGHVRDGDQDDAGDQDGQEDYPVGARRLTVGHAVSSS